MKRDMDLIRTILLGEEVRSSQQEKLASVPEDELLYHIALCIEAGLVRGTIIPDRNGGIAATSTMGLTWAGHDFLEAAADEGNWKNITGWMAKTGGRWTLETIKSVGTAVIKQKLQEHGIPFV